MRDWPLRLMLKKTNHHHTSTLSASSALYMTVRAPLRGSADIMPCKCVTPVHPHPTLSGALVGAQKPETRHTHINPSEQGSMSVVMFLISTLAWPPARRKYRDWNSFFGITYYICTFASIFFCQHWDIFPGHLLRKTQQHNTFPLCRFKKKRRCIYSPSSPSLAWLWADEPLIATGVNAIT